MRVHFSLKEKRKIATVLAQQRDMFESSRHPGSGFTNGHGGCPNCGDAGGFFQVMFALETLFGLRKEDGTMRPACKPLRRAKR